MEACFWLALSRLAILTVPFRRIAPFLGRTMLETPSTPPHKVLIPDQIGWAVRTAGRYTPWESKCLAQAMAARMMLKRRRIPATVYLGLSKENGLSAHAWLRCGEKILTGAPVHRQFTVVACFGENWK